MTYRFEANDRAGRGGKANVIVFRDGSRHERRLVVDDFIEAGKIVVKRTEPDPSWAKLPVDALVYWIIDRVENGRPDAPPRSKGYLKNVRIRLENHFLPVFTGTPVGEIRTSQLSSFRLELGDEKRKRVLKPSTITGICHTVDMLFRECVEVGVIPGPPPTEAAFATVTRSFRPKTIRYFEPDEQAAVLATEDPLRLFIAMCLFHAAMHEDEIGAVTLDDIGKEFISIKKVRLPSGELVVPSNTERVREIRLAPELKRHLQIVGWLGFDRSLPIIDQMMPAHTKVRPHLIGSRFRQLQRWAGVVDDDNKAKFTPLEAVHTCIIGWLSKPHDLEEITRQVGMASPERMLDKYMRWVFDPSDVETFDVADAELTDLLSAQRNGRDAE
nr:hypothetical protein [uncultured Devosia sp.]